MYACAMHVCGDLEGILVDGVQTLNQNESRETVLAMGRCQARSTDPWASGALVLTSQRLISELSGNSIRY